MSEITLEKLQELLQNQTLELKQDIRQCIQEVNNNALETNKEVNKLKSRCIFLERKVRRNNIVIFGIDVKNDSSLIDQTLDRLNGVLGLHISVADLNNVYRLGRHSKAPIVVEFISFLKKAEVFKNTEKLAALRGFNITISNDLCEEDRQEHKLLRKHLMEARQNNCQAKIRGHKLEINNKLYNLSDLEEFSESEEGEQEPLDEAINSRGAAKDNSSRQHGAINSKDCQDTENLEKKRKTQTSPSSSAVKVYKTRQTKKSKYI